MQILIEIAFRVAQTRRRLRQAQPAKAWAWWATERRALARAGQALRLRSIHSRDHDEPFAALIACTADPGKVDRRTRSKWSRLLRYALKYKAADEPLASFIKAAGGINQAVSRFAHQARSARIEKGRAL
ncbi:MAG: hypothetical protein ACJ72H_15475 [Candidatus Sulfotelmatobacter sp.]